MWGDISFSFWLSFHLLRTDQSKILKMVPQNCFHNSANVSQIWLYPLELHLGDMGPATLVELPVPDSGRNVSNLYAFSGFLS